MRLRAALAQITCRLGNLETNLKKHLEFIERAQDARADLLIFPELSLSGYVLQDLAVEVALNPYEDRRIFEPLLQASRNLDIVAGFVEEDRRRRFYIAGAYLSGGEIVHIHRKVYLPTYGMFDEKRFFAAGNQARAFDTRFGRVGLAICEDFWHVSTPYLLWMDGADLLIFTSAQPGHGVSAGPRMASTIAVDGLLQTYAGLFTTFVLYSNRVGFEDGICFPGGAAAVDGRGNFLAHAADFEESLTVVDLDLDQLKIMRASSPALRDERPDLVFHEMQRILKQENER